MTRATGTRGTGQRRHPPRPTVVPAPAPSVWERIAPAAVAFVLGGLLFGALAWFAAKPSDTEQRVQQLRAAEHERDARQVVDLTEKARDVRDRLIPVLEGMEGAIPTEKGAAAEPASADEVARWRETTESVTAGFADPPSGETATNIARSSLAAAARQLDAAVATYQVARSLPGSERGPLVRLAGRQRTEAVSTWSIGATQLDVVNVEAGRGHQHVFLPASPGSAAMTPDGAPEGSNGE